MCPRTKILKSGKAREGQRGCEQKPQDEDKSVLLNFRLADVTCPWDIRPMSERNVEVKQAVGVEVKEPDFSVLDGLLAAQDLRAASVAKRSMSGSWEGMVGPGLAEDIKVELAGGPLA